LSLADWEEEYAPPSLQTYIVYQFAFAFLTWAADHVSDKALTDKKTIGCRMDYCRDKHDLKLGMLAGYICPVAADICPSLGRDVCKLTPLNASCPTCNRRQKVMTICRTAFVVMCFTEDDNRLAYERGIKPGLRDVGIAAHRADDVVESRPLLEKITLQIIRARFIVAKVDVNRMNVYYELGLAMGARRNVLLVSEQNLVKRLPSDLSNWECLTYPKSDYAELRRRVAKFYRDNYHLGMA
jgi:hypothetical protein